MKKKMCPLIGDPCMEHDCEFYTHVVGNNPQTQGSIDHFGCAISFIPVLLIENSGQQRHTAAAVESFRNETLKANENFVALISNAAAAANEKKRLTS